MKLLTKSRLSERSLREKLVRQRIAEDQIDTAIETLKQRGFIDDMKAARSAVEAWLERQPADRTHYESKLHKLGIDRHTASSVLDEVLEHRSRIDDAVAALKGTPSADVRTLKEWQTRARRAAGKLARLGFDEDTIELVVDQVLGPQPEQETADLFENE